MAHDDDDILELSAEDRSEQARRLREARLAAGFKSARAFSDHLGINSTTYYQHESGRRPFGDAAARIYARKLGMEPAKLLFGVDLQSAPPARMIGYLRGQGRIEPVLGDPDGYEKYLTQPTISEGTDFIQVHGNENYPAYKHGDLVFFPALNGVDYSVVHGQDCVVQMMDGELLLRTVSLQKNGGVTLLSQSGPPEFDVQIAAASLVTMIVKAPPIRPSRVRGVVGPDIGRVAA